MILDRQLWPYERRFEEVTMMIAAGEYADVLRALGRVLDEVGAESVEITVVDSSIGVSCRRGNRAGEQRQYTIDDLETLRRLGKELRKGESELRTGYAEMLRTLGQDLDQTRAALTQISEQRDGMTVACLEGERQVRRKYLSSELLGSSRRRREMRAGRQPMGGAKPDWDGGDWAMRQSEQGPLSRRLGE
jgi:hypothetical protein